MAEVRDADWARSTTQQNSGEEWHGVPWGEVVVQEQAVAMLGSRQLVQQ